jgi:hypothetical protein
MSHEFEFDIDKDVKIEFDSDTDINLDKDVNVDIKVDQDIDLDGNLATATFDVQAHGSDTLAEVDIAVIAVEGEFSAVSGTMIAAAD